MRKSVIRIFVLLMFCISSLAIFVACNRYQSVYELSGCELNITEINNPDNNIYYNRQHIGKGYQVFVDSAIVNSKTIDEWIMNFEDFSEILNEKNINCETIYYLSKNVVASWCNSVENDGKKIIYVPIDAAKEEIFAWLLNASLDNSNLPYGIYAGVAAHWLELPLKRLAPTSIRCAGRLTDLQFPLYELDNMSVLDRIYAWKFSYTLIDDWKILKQDELSILDLSKSELDDYLYSMYGVLLPKFSFSPYSTAYEYKVDVDNFTYYINRQFRDLILPDCHFTTKYDQLTDWLDDNYETTIASNQVFDITDMHHIDVYLNDGKGKFSDTVIGEANMVGYEGFIRIYSVGAFSREYIHQVLFAKGQNGYLREVIPDLHADTSKYSKLMWYYLFSGQASHYKYNESVNERKMYVDSMKLYNKLSPDVASESNFHFWLFADCLASLNTQIGQKFVHKLQPNSLQYYIYRVYGADYVWAINMNNEILIDGKTYLEVTYEWIDYLDSLS